MPNFYCEYCGIYLKHSSPFGRKQHSRGKKHIYNKIEFYSQFLIEFQQQHECRVDDSNNIYREQDDGSVTKAVGATSGTASRDAAWGTSLTIHATAWDASARWYASSTHAEDATSNGRNASRWALRRASSTENDGSATRNGRDASSSWNAWWTAASIYDETPWSRGLSIDASSSKLGKLATSVAAATTVELS